MENRSGMAPQQSAWWAVPVVALVVIALFVAGRSMMPSFSRARDIATIDSTLGATLEPLDAAAARSAGAASRSGMVVTSVASEGPAYRAGVRVGDVIEAIDGRPPGLSAQVAKALRRSPASVILNRQGKRAMVTFPIRPAARPGYVN